MCGLKRQFLLTIDLEILKTFSIFVIRKNKEKLL